MSIMRIAWCILEFISIVVGLLTGFPSLLSVLENLGIDMTFLTGWLVANSFWLLPVCCIVFGLLTGVAIDQEIQKRVIKYPILKPEQADVLLEIFDSGTKRYPNDHSIAQALEGLGAIERSSGKTMADLSTTQWRVTSGWNNYIHKKRKYLDTLSAPAKKKRLALEQRASQVAREDALRTAMEAGELPYDESLF